MTNNARKIRYWGRRMSKADRRQFAEMLIALGTVQWYRDDKQLRRVYGCGVDRPRPVASAHTGRKYVCEFRGVLFIHDRNLWY